MEQKEIQNEYNEIIDKIKNIKQEIFGNPKKSDSITEEAINVNQSVANIQENFILQRFKKTDEKIFEENQMYIEQLKPLIEQADKVWNNRYGISCGGMNPYEEFVHYTKNFNEDKIGYRGCYYNEHLQSYFTYLLDRMTGCASYIAKGQTRWNKEDFTNEERALIPTDEINAIVQEISDLKFEYKYMNKKAINDFETKDMALRNKLDDYRYEKAKIEYYCKKNNIKINIHKECTNRWIRQ